MSYVATSGTTVRRPLSTRLLIALGLTAVAGLVLWLFFEVLLVASVWPAVESPPRQGEAVLVSSLDTPNPVHSPTALARAVREPQNAWSCLGFVFVAALLVQGAKDALARWFALTVATTGICAMLYHASATRDFRNADIAGLYWSCALISVIAAARLGTLDARAGTGLRALAIWAGLGVLAVAAMASRNFEIAGFKPLALPVVTAVAAILVASMLLIFCLRQGDPRKWRLGLGAIALMGVGFLLQAGDHPGGMWCAPDAWIQPHAMWHVLCAAGLALAMECFESPAHPIA